MSFKLELRDSLFLEKIRSTGSRRLKNNIMVLLGYSFYYPLMK
jgi:hypothetical protein